MHLDDPSIGSSENLAAVVGLRLAVEGGRSKMKRKLQTFTRSMEVVLRELMVVVMTKKKMRAAVVVEI